MKKKKECDAKAQSVVEKLLDPIDDEDELKLLVGSTFVLYTGVLNNYF